MRLSVFSCLIVSIVAIGGSSISHASPIITCNERGCSDYPTSVTPRNPQKIKNYKEDGVRFLPNPPCGLKTRFCGAGAAWDLFGKCIPSLYRAAAWFKFPRTHPAPDMVGVSRSHVFVLKQHIEGDIWLVADYNSGNHKSRLHAKSIKGWTIVNPHGALALN